MNPEELNEVEVKHGEKAIISGIGIVNEYVNIPRANLSFVDRFPQGCPGTIIERNGKKFVVTRSGAQVRVKE